MKIKYRGMEIKIPFEGGIYDKHTETIRFKHNPIIHDGERVAVIPYSFFRKIMENDLEGLERLIKEYTK